jgi:hypothetical protein
MSHIYDHVTLSYDELGNLPEDSPYQLQNLCRNKRFLYWHLDDVKRVCTLVFFAKKADSEAALLTSPAEASTIPAIAKQ